MLDFLAVFVHANACAASAILSSSTFMPRLISWMSKSLDNRPVLELTRWNMLRTSTLLLLGFAYSHFKICCSQLTSRFPEFDLDAFVDVVLDSESDWMLETCLCPYSVGVEIKSDRQVNITTGALARYAIATEEARILDDPMVVLEVWSRLRDALLATLQHRFVEDYESISVAISGTLCASLVSILGSAGGQTSKFVLSCFHRLAI
jgi:hypothetical protein